MNDLTAFPTDQMPRFQTLFIAMIIHHALMGADFPLPAYQVFITITGLSCIHRFFSIEKCKTHPLKELAASNVMFIF
ncbi:MAG: hypothetical protein KC592_01500 [Nitrospira sp.]|nr:hypothetical protein [Nitrospira sp.]